MKSTIRVLLAVATAVLLTSCGAGKNDGPPPLTPMPGNVPAKPEYTTADSVVASLGKAGIDCKIIRRAQADPEFGSGLTCLAELHGTKFENEISVSNPQRFERDRVGNSIASRRKPPFSHTIVAAGNWYIRVLEPRYAPQIATALHGVVLPPEDEKIPDYPLPKIPDAPRYTSVDALADDLDSAAGCTQRGTGPTGVLTCTTGKRVGRSPNCATLSLYPSRAERDAALRKAIAYKGVPATLVTGGNWTVNLCDYGLGARVAERLHGQVVSYNGS